jgi:acyl-CoA reductase-like NAD-dependent aldehyde dehydrogenase
MAISWSQPCLPTSTQRCASRRKKSSARSCRSFACEDLEDAIEIANGIEYGLSSALYTKDVNRAFAAIRDLHAGITYINAPTIGAEVHLPFGGVKATGNGHREGGLGAIDFYTEWKSVYVDYSDKLQKAQIDRAE